MNHLQEGRILLQDLRARRPRRRRLRREDDLGGRGQVRQLPALQPAADGRLPALRLRPPRGCDPPAPPAQVRRPRQRRRVLPLQVRLDALQVR